MQYKHICDNLVASLVLNLKISYDEVLNMSFENALMTYAIFYINSVNEYENIKAQTQKIKGVKNG